MLYNQIHWLVVNIDVDTRGRGLVMAMIIVGRMVMMLVIVSVFYATGSKKAGHEQEQECSK
jgi:spore maturation protein SpmB